jgi:hypothetical protein
MNNSPEVFYRNKIDTSTAQRASLQKKHALLGWLRLLAAVIEGVAVYTFWQTNIVLLSLITVALTAIFLRLVAVAVNTNAAIENYSRIIIINETELKVLAGQYQLLPQNPAAISEYQNVETNDLDVFGQASLFQYTNRSSNEFAQAALANAFTKPATAEQIRLKQQAVKELVANIGWCQQLQSLSNITALKTSQAAAIKQWVHHEKNSFDGISWQLLRILVPCISFTSLGLYISDVITASLFNTIMILVLAFVFSFFKKISRSYEYLAQQVPVLTAVATILKHIETANFKSEILTSLQNKITEPEAASATVNELKNILKRFELRLNPVVYIPLSIFLFWDLQQALALQQWKKKQSLPVQHWFNIAGEFEMLASLAVLHFNNPHWCFPEITDNWFTLQCSNIGHPLLSKTNAVLNSYSMEGTPAVSLITGSNMAGKSTFLRTIGANIILANTGAPVHAKAMAMPVVRIISSMRITDNLEEGTSTFYAELKKIKRIVDAVNAGEKVFILIDEMLRGTNTLDRHTGSVALVKQLIKKNAVAMVASHDVALSDLITEFPQAITNYHFDSAIIKNEIVFDYRLKEGVCTSTNASLLMKKIGIDL